MAAVIIKGGTLLSVGFNRIEEHPAAYFGCSFHAEYDAIRKSNANLQGAKMFIYRFGRKHGYIKSSKPCELCQQEIAKVKIKSVIYVDDDHTLQKSSYRIEDVPAPHQVHSYMNDPSIYVR
jgi:deoxycytidylate deaminase